MASEERRASEPIDAETRVVAAGDLLEAEVDDELVILDYDSETYFGLNEVGAFVWERIQDPATVGAVVDDAVAAFEVSRSTVREDVHAFVLDLEAAELVERV